MTTHHRHPLRILLHYKHWNPQLTSGVLDLCLWHYLKSPVLYNIIQRHCPIPSRSTLLEYKATLYQAYNVESMVDE